MAIQLKSNFGSTWNDDDILKLAKDVKDLRLIVSDLLYEMKEEHPALFLKYQNRLIRISNTSDNVK